MPWRESREMVVLNLRLLDRSSTASSNRVCVSVSEVTLLSRSGGGAREDSSHCAISSVPVRVAAKSCCIATHTLEYGGIRIAFAAEA